MAPAKSCYGSTDATFPSKLPFVFNVRLIPLPRSAFTFFCRSPTLLLCRLINKALFVLAPMRIGQMPLSMETDYPQALPNANFFVLGSTPRLLVINYASLSICRLQQRVAWHEDESECQDSQQGAEVLARVYSI